MRASVPAAPATLFALVASAAVLVAGCTAQDRPHEPTFTIVADAGGEIVGTGSPAALHWTPAHAIESEPGEPAEVEPVIAWNSSSGDHAEGPDFNVTANLPGLLLVELNVTAKNHTAVDVGGVLGVPTAPGARRAFIGVVGNVTLAVEGGGAFTADLPVALRAHVGHYYSLPTPGASVRLRIVQGADEVEAAFLICVKDAVGIGQTNKTLPLVLNPELNYTLVLDSSTGAHHHIEVHEGTDLVEDLSLAEFEEAHAGDAEGRFTVVPKGQTLPGLEAAAAVGALVIAFTAAYVRRR